MENDKNKKKEEVKKEKKHYICDNCGREYDPIMSESQRNDLFCCIACEYGY